MKAKQIRVRDPGTGQFVMGLPLEVLAGLQGHVAEDLAEDPALSTVTPAADKLVDAIVEVARKARLVCPPGMKLDQSGGSFGFLAPPEARRSKK